MLFPQIMLKWRRSRVIWTQPRSSDWWNTIASDFSPQQFVQNFRVSRESFEYICNQLGGVLGRRNTNYRRCIPNKKRVAIALWKLATGGEYRTISHLFGVGLSTVCVCVQDFCRATMEVLLPLHIKFPNVVKLVDMATFFNNR